MLKAIGPGHFPCSMVRKPQNRSRWLVCFRLSDLLNFKLYCCLLLPDVWHRIAPFCTNWVHEDNSQKNLYINTTCVSGPHLVGRVLIHRWYLYTSFTVRAMQLLKIGTLARSSGSQVRSIGRTCFVPSRSRRWSSVHFLKAASENESLLSPPTERRKT